MIYLNVKGYPKDCIRNVKGYFQFHRDKSWFSDSFVQKIIKTIDDTDVVVEDVLRSPVFGAMSPDRLSSGAKALIIMYKVENANVYATRCGDNCIPLIEEIQEQKDLHLTLHHCMKFSDGVKVQFMDSGNVTETRKEYVHEWYKCYRGV